MSLNENISRGKNIGTSTKETTVKKNKISLETKMNNFFKWYSENMGDSRYPYFIEFKTNQIKNFIEKMAVWYELRYPSYEINRLMPGSIQEENDVNEAMFKNNKYINELFDEQADVRVLDWCDFYNFEAFKDSLPADERMYLNPLPYDNYLYLIGSELMIANLQLSSKGFVEDSKRIEEYTDYKVKDEEIKNMYIKDVVELMKSRGVLLPSDNSLENAIRKFENWEHLREEILNCVMYRIIERGGNRIGPRRAFLFAKEFDRNVEIPMIYGMDRSDPGLKSFINEYIKAGGSTDLVCYLSYLSATSEVKQLNTITIQELLKGFKDYTEEEQALYQRLVNALASNVDANELTEEIKTLKLQVNSNKTE